jgi:hypothetical protein
MFSSLPYGKRIAKAADFQFPRFFTTLLLGSITALGIGTYLTLKKLNRQLGIAMLEKWTLNALGRYASKRGDRVVRLDILLFVVFFLEWQCCPRRNLVWKLNPTAIHTSVCVAISTQPTQVHEIWFAFGELCLPSAVSVCVVRTPTLSALVVTDIGRFMTA